MSRNAEQTRLDESNRGDAAWRKWGPYLSERQWGTVREDYSRDGSAWDFLPHDHARSRAYRWGEDGLAGVSDDRQRLCLALALWNGRDPILKERLFGLTNSEANHGEDVKELYYYVDATPTHSYLKMLYKYPQAEFPYGRLVAEGRGRSRHEPEFELLDSGVLDEDRYFDVFVEYAKAGPDDLFMVVTAHNRGPQAATLHILPQLWFRNTWSWGRDDARPELSAVDKHTVRAAHPELGEYFLHADGADGLLFCENETNLRRLFGVDGGQRHAKDAFHEHIVRGAHDAVNPDHRGTKCGVLHRIQIAAGAAAQVRLRLSPGRIASPFGDATRILEQRRREADEFYADLQQDIRSADARLVQRQALAGMIWNKQFYHFDVPQWLDGDPGQPPPPPERRHGRNRDWRHLNNADVISMCDKWEYPWYAAWDLAFHCIPLAMVDAQFAKDQLVLLTREWYMHPNGQIPAYEWAFGDVNPPVHAWSAWRVFQMDRRQRRERDPRDPGDLAFLERVFHKLMLNFTWWVNRKDAHGRNIFQGGFLGMDNVGVFDRSAPLPTGGLLNQSDGTSWMAMYCLNLMRIALELALHNRVYEDIATKFFEHFLEIAKAMTAVGCDTAGCGGHGLWNEQDEFFYDVLNLPDGRVIPLRLRSMVGLIPLFAVETLEPELLNKLPEFRDRMEWFLRHRPELAALVSRWTEPGRGERRLLSLLRGHRMKRVLRRMLDETEFLSDYGVRSLSRAHSDQPFVFHCDGAAVTVRYEPAESTSGLFGGNSNWRGPIWFPVNYLIVESLQKFHHYYGDDFRIEYPTGSGAFVTINDVADELARRLTRTFLRGPDGRRPVLGANARLQDDPHFRDYVPFHEYFHGDDGRGLGASHQCGWTGLAAKLLMPRRSARASDAQRPAARPSAARKAVAARG